MRTNPVNVLSLLRITFILNNKYILNDVRALKFNIKILLLIM